jgi:hypothetical protein
MTSAAVARVAPVARKETGGAKTVTTHAAVATTLATLNRLRSLTNSHTSHKCHRPRTDHRNPIVGSHSIISERVARSISSSIVVRVERVASPQRFQGLGPDHQGSCIGQCGNSRAASEYAWRSRAPP